jgi:hypothetical protein
VLYMDEAAMEQAMNEQEFSTTESGAK